MFMRFRGGGVGHQITRSWDDILQGEGDIPTDCDIDEALMQLPSLAGGSVEGDEDEAADDHDEDLEQHAGEGAAEETAEEEIDIIEGVADEHPVHDEDILAQENYGTL